MRRLVFISLAVLALAVVAWNTLSVPLPSSWSEQERALIQSMALSQLPSLAPDPSNAVADSELAVEMGHHLYFDTRLSSNNTVACATCHQPQLYFTDGLELAVGIGIGDRHTPSLVGLSHSPWYYWDGRKDSQWAQALAPLESSHEHNTDRLEVSKLVTTDPYYLSMYSELFGLPPELPQNSRSASPLAGIQAKKNWNQLSAEQRIAINTVFTNVGKVLAAYQRKILPGPGRFDAYAESLAHSNAIDSSEALSDTEIAGLRLFIGNAQCVSCHNGPLFTNHDFHNTGVLSLSGNLPPMGRYDGIRFAREDEFNCLGDYSDAEAAECTELRFARDTNELVGAHKTPSLRNVAETAPYMHGGQLKTLQEVMQHYNEAPVSMLSHNEAKPLGLRPVELRQLEAFMASLTAPLATDPKWLSPPTTNP